MKLFGRKMKLALVYKYYFNTKNHFSVPYYSNDYSYLTSSIGLAFRHNRKEGSYTFHERVTITCDTLFIQGVGIKFRNRLYKLFIFDYL